MIKSLQIDQYTMPDRFYDLQQAHFKKVSSIYSEALNRAGYLAASKGQDMIVEMGRGDHDIYVKVYPSKDLIPNDLNVLQRILIKSDEAKAVIEQLFAPLTWQA
jgi:hypothetical protein